MAMTLGTENKRATYWAVGLLLVGGYFMWQALGGGGNPAPVAALPAIAVPAAGSGSADRVAVSLDPTLHLDELDRLRAIEYAGTGRDLFHFGAAPPPAAAGRGAAGAKSETVAAANAPEPPRTPPPPPPPPPIPLKFFGYADPTVGTDKVFLQLGDESYVAAEGDTVEHRYLVEKINKTSVRVKDLQTEREQDLPLAGG